MQSPKEQIQKAPFPLSPEPKSLSELLHNVDRSYLRALPVPLETIFLIKVLEVFLVPTLEFWSLDHKSHFQYGTFFFFQYGIFNATVVV